jgi:hypothetical protein
MTNAAFFLATFLLVVSVVLAVVSSIFAPIIDHDHVVIVDHRITVIYVCACKNRATQDRSYT